MRARLALLWVLGLTAWQPASAGAPPASAAPTVLASRTLQNLPNTAITYYDVSGTNLRAINESILSQQGDEVSTSSAKWDIGLGIQKRQTGGKCTIVGADVRFSATVKLPRLTTENQVPREVRQAWDKYLAALQARQAADLWFVYDHLPEVQQATRSSTCEGAGAAAAAAVEKIKAEEAEFMRSLGAAQVVGK